MRKLLLILLIFASTAIQAQSRYSGWFFSARGTANGFMLDKIQNPAAAAYSFRKLRDGYTGSAIRVRRSSDNAESDIGFDASGNLNTSALSSFVGSNSAFVVTWYDQSGNGINLTQSTAANQPRIVNTGTVDQMGSRPSQRGDATDFLEGADALGGSANEVDIFFVTNLYSFINSANGNTFFGLAETPRFTANMPWSDSNIYFDIAGTSAPNRVSISGQMATNTSYQFNLTHSVAQNIQRVRKNGSQIGNDGSGHTIASAFTRVSRTSPNGIQGFYPEFILFKGLVSDNEREVIERNQGAYYSITIN
jgi:hypothetical protein